MQIRIVYSFFLVIQILFHWRQEIVENRAGIQCDKYKLHFKHDTIDDICIGETKRDGFRRTRGLVLKIKSTLKTKHARGYHC